VHLLLDVGEDLLQPVTVPQAEDLREPHAAVAVEVCLAEDVADGAAGLQLARRRLQGLRHLHEECAEVVRGAGVDGEEHPPPSFIRERVRSAAHPAEGVGLAVRSAGDPGERGRGQGHVVRAAARSRGPVRAAARAGVHELELEAVAVLLAFREVIGQAQALQRVRVRLVRLEVLRLRHLHRAQAVHGPRAVGRLAHFLDGREQQADEDRDDRDHDEQLDEGESGFALRA
jgi:hypothetical protein